jgi:tetratricopeptide (TPR) repeat protein/predicted nucleic acid-binding protein
LEKEPLESRVCMADIYRDHGYLDAAISILSEIETTAISFDEGYFAMYGFLLFSKGIGNESLKSEYVIHGYGASHFDLDLIKKALGFYDEAYSLLSSKGFPILFEHTIINYAAILDLLGLHPKAEVILRTYLYHHPNSTMGTAALANALFKQSKNFEAIPYAKKAFRDDEESSTSFVNYVLLLSLTEQYDEVLKVVSQRINEGFRSKREEGIARGFAVMAYKELGFMKLASEQVDLMKKDDALKVDAIIGSAYLIEDKNKVVELYKQGLGDSPDDVRLLTNYLAELLPVKKENAAEVKKLLSKTRQHRQLSPEEYYVLGRANLLLELPEESERIVREGMERYPDEHGFAFEHAESLFMLGYEEECYRELSAFLNEGKKDYSLMKNMAIVTMNTNRIDEAINFLTLALKKARSDFDRGDIHCQLYELKKVKGYPAKELLAHVVELGRVSKDTPEMEARYLSLFMTSPEIPTEEMDAEVNSWVKDFRSRLESFATKYPDFPTFRMFSLPKDMSDEDQIKDFLSTLAYMTLPQELATASVKIATRSGEWPLIFRAKLLYSLSIFEYWSVCTESDEAQHGIHIWGSSNNLNQEIKAVSRSSTVCVDLSAFLTLAEFELLPVLTDLYSNIIISHETKALLNRVVLGYKRAHPIAVKIWEWIKENRAKVRTRSVFQEEVEEAFIKRDSGLFMKASRSPKKTFEDGIGETLLLAHKLQLPLYSDEAAIRQLGRDNYNLQVLSTIGVVNYLNSKGKLSISNIAMLYSMMINKNFRIVPFTAEHLHVRLQEKRQAIITTGKKYLKSEELLSDDVLGPLMKQFGDFSLSQRMAAVAIDWWIAILKDPEIPIEQLDECVSYLSYSLSMKTVSAVTLKVFAKEQEERIARLLAIFLWKTYLRMPERVNLAWSASKSCCKKYFREREELLLFQLIPKHLKKIMEEAILPPLEKSTAIFNIPASLPAEDRPRFEEYFVKNKPNFIR